MKAVHNLSFGYVIFGKWKKKKYIVLRHIGSGMNGEVYLVGCEGIRYALKIGQDYFRMIEEVNALKRLQKAVSDKLGPSFFHMDDAIDENGNVAFSFYVMSYIEGGSPLTYVQQHGLGVLPLFMLKLLKKIDVLHDAGYCYGDIKIENILVHGNSHEVQLVDVGGVTLFGRVIKEYTERYDRGYWKVGLRTAETTYDLFSIGMIIVHLVEGSTNFAQFTTIAQVRQSVAIQNRYDGIRKTVEGMLSGKFATTKMAINQLLTELDVSQGVPIQLEKSETKRNTTISAHSTKRIVLFCVSVIILCCTVVIFLF